MQTRQSTLPAAVLALLCLLLCATQARAQARPECPLPEPTGFHKYVSDFANVVDQTTKDRVSAMLNELKEKGDIEFAVVTVPTTGGQSPFDYSLAIARCWGIGSSEGEKNGLLLLVAVEDRKYQIQVSRHLEGDLPDGLVGEIGRRMREPFRKTPPDYSAGLTAAVQTFVATLEEKRGFKIEGTDPRYAYQPRAQRPRSTQPTRGSLGLGACCIIGVVVMLLLSMFRGGRGRRGGRWRGRRWRRASERAHPRQRPQPVGRPRVFRLGRRRRLIFGLGWRRIRRVRRRRRLRRRRRGRELVKRMTCD